MTLEKIDAAATLAELRAVLHVGLGQVEECHFGIGPYPCRGQRSATPEIQLGDDRCNNCDDPIADYEFYYHVCDEEGCRAVGFYCLECTELHNALGGYFCKVCGEWTEFD